MGFDCLQEKNVQRIGLFVVGWDCSLDRIVGCRIGLFLEGLDFSL